ncbi:MAG TPA: DinB family protein [Trebonia sp.]
MATSAELLLDGFGRIRESVADVLDGLTPEQLAYRVDDDANPVSWLVWHLTRIQDDHLAAAFGLPQVWSSDGWAERLGLPAGMMDHGYGHNRQQVASVAAATAVSGLLGEYHEATYAQTIKLVSEIRDADLDRVVDTRWTPAVTLGVRLISVLDDDMQHVGQAAFVRGVVLRRS